MDSRIICEVMLYAYKELEDKCKKIDYKVLRVALGSRSNDVFESADRIYKLTDEKIAYCNTKVILDEAFKQMKRCDEIKAFHIQGLQCKDIAEQYNINVNLVCKRLVRQREKLYQTIIENNKAEDLQAIISDSGWLAGRYNATLKAQNQAVSGERIKGKETHDQKGKKAHKGK